MRDVHQKYACEDHERGRTRTRSVREKRDETAGMDGGGLEVLQHPDRTREEQPEQRQQLQQQLNPKLQLKLQPKPQPAPMPRTVPTTARRWETVPPQAQSERAPLGQGPALTVGLSMAERRLVL